MTHSGGSTVPAILEKSVRLWPQSPALGTLGQGMWSYQDLASQVAAVMDLLTASGLKPGDRVAILGENQSGWGAAYFGILASGMVGVPLLPDFSAREVGVLLGHCEARGIFVSEKQRAKIPADLPDLAVMEIPPQDQPVPQRDFKSIPISEQDLAVIIYTSGTTGDPKGVMLTHRNLTSNVEAAAVIPAIKPGQSMLSILPLSHTYECTLGLLLPISMGCQVTYLDRPASPAVLLPALAQVRPHLMLSVPLIMEKIFKSRVKGVFESSPVLGFLYKLPPIRKLLHFLAGKKLKATFGGRLHFFGVGGAALTPEVERFLKEAKFPYAIGYGLTETSPLVAGASPLDTRYRSTGPGVTGVEIRLDNVSSRGIGEVLVRGPGVMKGYYKNPEKTAEVLDSEGWFRTGDLGKIRKDFLYITGRLKNVIIGPSGENIYPETIESLLSEFRYVMESIVIEKGGKLLARVHLNYQELLEHHRELAENSEKLRQWVDLFFKEILEKCNHHLAAFSRLSGIIEQPTPFEKTPTLKIKRYMYEFA